MKTYINNRYELNYDGYIQSVKCIDIEFEGGLGPLFLMQTKGKEKFWLTTKEMREIESTYKV